MDDVTIHTDSIDHKLMDLLDRKTELNALDALVYALRPDSSAVALQETAIAFDANVVLRISSHSKTDDIVDYFNSKHIAPLIVPGQVIQEFWNNQLTAVDTVAKSLRQSHDKLRVDIAKVDSSHGEFSSRFNHILDEFTDAYGYLFDENLVRKTHKFFELIKQKAYVPFVQRGPFSPIAAHRKRTKTPPGFKDDGDGDFFVWLDLLKGVLDKKANGAIFSRVVLVTNEKKLDWNREGTPHPILIAEIKAVAGVSFEVWDLERLVREIASAP